MFVWIVHRVTGLLLIGLLAVKFVTGFFLMTKAEKPDWALLLHTNPLTDTFLIIAGVYHAVLRPEDGRPRPGRTKREALSSGSSAAWPRSSPRPCSSSTYTRNY